MILDRQRTVRVALRPLELFLKRIQKALGLRKTDVTVCLVSDAEIARMNRVFRKKNGPTDVLSFPAEARDKRARVGASRRVPRTIKEDGSLRRRDKLAATRARRGRRAYLGDIAISPKTARRNAKEGGRPLQTEMRILILHGVLHLLGYDHETDQGQMERLEQRLRRRLKLA